MKARTLKPVERPSRLFAAVLALVDRLQDGEAGAPVELPADEWAELHRLAVKECAEGKGPRMYLLLNQLSGETVRCATYDDARDAARERGWSSFRLWDSSAEIQSSFGEWPKSETKARDVTPRGTSVWCDDCGGVCEGDGTGQQLCTCAVPPPKRFEPSFSVKNLEATATTPKGYVAPRGFASRQWAVDWAKAEGWRSFEVYDSTGRITDGVELPTEKPKRQRRAKAKAPEPESPSADATPSAPAAEQPLPFATDADTPPSAPESIAGVYGGAS